ncbi:NUDIX domain-containing protein [Brevundimonas sp. 2R-24]|uniref:NUDIX domain-containing protein n=1 Tax=Peiella sedimenti TaxID=3061083 RepID=A0ABT8SPL3_9CAUL|nr:NUDIX domain-containing protein [Caulobacteraceae bacterium XZ-24]
MRLRFGRQEPGVDYRVRPCAFGVIEREGRIACVRVTRQAGPYYDLPGGAIDEGETEDQALAREFVEETGLTIAAGRRFAEADQLFRKSDGEPVENRCAFFTGAVAAENPAAKIEDDHALVWLTPLEAISGLRHEAHAWAVAVWLRLREA